MSSVQSLSCVRLCDPMDCSTPGLPVHQQFLELAQIHVHLVSDAIQPSHSLLSPSPPTFNLASIRVFSNESVFCMRWPNYWSFSFSISLSNDYSGLISFRMDWLDLLAVQETLKSSPTPQFKNINSSVLSFLYSPNLTSKDNHWKKIIALTRRTFVDKVMSLLFNMLSRLVITSLPRSKRLLISWLQSPSAVILEPPQIEVLLNKYAIIYLATLLGASQLFLL